MANLREITSGTGFQNGQANAGDSRFWTYRGETSRGNPRPGVPQAAINAVDNAGSVVRYYWWEYTGTDTDLVDGQINRMWANAADFDGDYFTLISESTTGNQVSTWNPTTRRQFSFPPNGFNTNMNLNMVPWRGGNPTNNQVNHIVFAVWLSLNFTDYDVTERNNWGRVITNGNVNAAGWTIVDSTTQGLQDFNFTLPVNLLNLSDPTVTVNRNLAIEPDGTIVVDTSGSGTGVSNVQIIQPATLGDTSTNLRVDFSNGTNVETDLPRLIMPDYFYSRGGPWDLMRDPVQLVAAPPDDIGTAGQVLHVVENAQGTRRLEFTSPTSSITVQEEGGTPVEDVSLIEFDSRHFAIAQRSDGGAEVVLTASAAGSGVTFEGVDIGGNITRAPQATTLVSRNNLITTVSGDNNEIATIDVIFPNSVDYTDLSVTVSGNQVNANSGDGTAQTVLFNGVDSHLDWQVGQAGYALTADQQNLFEFTVVNFMAPEGIMEVTVADGEVIRRVDFVAGPGVSTPIWSIFAGAPNLITQDEMGDPIDPIVIDIPELSTRRELGHQLVEIFLTVYTVTIVESHSSATGNGTAFLPNNTQITDGAFSIVKNPTDYDLVVSARTGAHQIQGETTVLSQTYTLAPGEAAEFVYSDKVNAWVVINHDRVEGGEASIPSIFQHIQETAASTWTIHNMSDTTRPIITVYNTSGEVILPQNIETAQTTSASTGAVTSRTITITFPINLTGSVTYVG